MAVVVSEIQVYAAIQNNRLVEAQTIVGFIPHLMKIETRAVALVTMNKYVDRDVVIEMASLLKSEVALEELSKKGTRVEKTPNQKSGVIKTLVLFSGFDPLILNSYEENLEQFFGKIDKNCPQTRSNINKLRGLIKANKAMQPTPVSSG